MSRSMKKILGVFLIALVSGSVGAQSDCDGARYRYNTVFPEIQVTYDIPYGIAINATGLSQALVVDIYEPVGDFNTERPLLIMAHGGFFISGENDNPDVVSLCEDFARMGYVVGSISYRLGIDNFLDLSNSMIRSVWRGYHDGKAAVRYFRKTVAEDENPWGVDADRIIVGGVSAGAFIGLHMAYVDEESEIPEQIDATAAGMAGGLEGESGNPGYSSEVIGVFNVAGALKTASYLSAGDEPLVSVHGTEDGTVPFGAGVISLSGIPITDVEGSSVIHAVADELGIVNCLTPIEGGGHVPHISNAADYVTTLATLAGALSSWLCASYDPICGEYDFTSNQTELDPAQFAQFQAYPNPVGEGIDATLQFRGMQGQSWNWEIWDASGRLVQAGLGTGETAVIPTSKLVPGPYILRVPSLGEAQRLMVR